jgi:hypothetical protein
MFFFHQFFSDKKYIIMKEEDIICAHDIPLLCNTYIGAHWQMMQNKKIDTDYFLFVDAFKNNKDFNNPKKVFVYNNISKFFINELLRYQRNPMVLVTHDGDQNILEQFIPILESNRIEHWFGQNFAFEHKKATNIPLGVANEENKKILHKVMEMNIKKTNDIFMNFDVNTNMVDRTKCKEILEKKGINFIPQYENYEEYLMKLASYKFAICPIGRSNGFDTNRIWECLYLNVVPICVANKFTIIQRTMFPMVLVKSWYDLDISKLDYNLFDFNRCQDKLSLSYYKKLLEEYKKN